MRYRLTAKGKFVFTVLPLLLIFSICAIVFGVNTFVQARNGQSASEAPHASGDPTMSHSLSPTEEQTPPGESTSPLVSEDSPVETPVSTDEQSKEPVEEQTETPTVSDEPSLAPNVSHAPGQASAIPIQTAAPRPVDPVTPAPINGIYDKQYMVMFSKNSDSLDQKVLSKQLKDTFSTSTKAFVPPNLTSHYLVIQGSATKSEDPDIALNRAKFVRDVLKDIGFPDNKLLVVSEEDNGVTEATSVLLQFMPISK